MKHLIVLSIAAYCSAIVNRKHSAVSGQWSAYFIQKYCATRTLRKK
ncbi:hypothetical protein [Moorena sp. SIO4E2]|nr:hypothetical protein [Moorena sp. SIO4E2]